jgi:hypothetical protein
MPIIVVTRLKSNQDHTPIVKEAAAILKKPGAVSVRAGRCYSGEYTGQLIVATAFPDWAAFGRSAQALSADPEWQKFLTEAAKVSELQDRSIVASEEF